jgi:hypothetical protein
MLRFLLFLVVVSLLGGAMWLAFRLQEKQFVQPYSSEMEADEDDCAGMGPDDAREIARRFPNSPCVELVKQWEKK